MTSGIPAVVDDDQTSGLSLRPRDADATRQTLLRAARRRFALDGYSATTVRDIAGDAGVNVSLINRYFTSKEGLFEACLQRAAASVDRTAAVDLDELVQSVVSNVAGALVDDDSYQLLLLLRTSGDSRADRIRLDTLRSFAERIASVAGWSATDPSTRDLLLRAQLAVSMSLGIALLRVSGGGLHPLSDASIDELTGPLHDAFSGLLSRENSEATSGATP